MRKLHHHRHGIAVVLAIPASASAAVERCKVTTTVTAPSVTTATFTVFEPRDSKDSFVKVWTTSYNVSVSADGKTFEGVGNITDGMEIDVPMTIKGTFNADGTISYAAKPVDTDNNAVWVLDNGITDGTTVNPASTLNIEGQPSVGTNVKVTKPEYKTVPGETTTTTTEYKNHGEYVSSLGGGKVAAQACQGMPVVSTQGKFVSTQGK